MIYIYNQETGEVELPYCWILVREQLEETKGFNMLPEGRNTEKEVFMFNMTC